MGRLRGTDGEWLDSEEDKLDGLMRERLGKRRPKRPWEGGSVRIVYTVRMR